MNFSRALGEYLDSQESETLERVTGQLCKSMSFREKTRMLSGGFFAFAWRVILGKVLQGSLFHYPFRGSGCRRLGVPALLFSDGPRGAVTGHSTCFPVALARAASFDPELEYRTGSAMALEARAAGANFFAGICLNLVRNPRWGRSQESWGEDPCLLGTMGEAMVRAVQDCGLIACPKHFALNSIENLRFIVSADTDPRSLREIWLPQFRKAVEAGALAVMGAYNKVNGEYCGENQMLLTRILRDEWRFEGLVMSDFIWGIHDTAAALKAGMDWEMPVPFFFSHRRLGKAIKRGHLLLEDVDRAVCRILKSVLRQHHKLRPPQPGLVKSAEHLSLAEESATASMVLLKNSGAVLPLTGGTRIAVVGPFADRLNLGDHGSSMVVPGKEGLTAAQGIARRFDRVETCQGVNIPQILKAAAGAEVVVACVGFDYRGEGEFLINAGEDMERKPRSAIGGDRESLDLPPDQTALLAALKKAGKKVIVVLHTGSIILTDPLEPWTDALVLAWYGGVRFGSALAALLSGDRDFSGKLPISMARDALHYPGFLEIGQKPCRVSYGYYNGYWHLARQSTEPAYPFGFGLTYTSFSLEGAEAVRTAGGDLRVSVNVTNTGERSGTEVVQVYVGSTDSRTGQEHRPRPMLKGFGRVGLKPGQSSRIEIGITLRDLEFYDPVRGEWELDPVYTIQVGTSSADRRCPGLTIRFD